MGRHSFLVAALSLLPLTASAQIRLSVDEGWGPFVRATPFVGLSPSFRSSGNLAVATQTAIIPLDYDFEYGAGAVAGVNVEVRAWNRFSGIGALAWSSRGRTVFETDDGELFEDAGSDLFFVKAGGAMRFREPDSDLQRRRLNASVFLAAAFIREKPEVLLFSASEFTKSRNHWGVNFGAEGELPLPDRRFAFHGALEDYMIMWDDEAVRQRLAGSIRGAYGADAEAIVAPDRSHVIMMRLGFSYRWDR
jgi:hypothetical protein